MRTWGQKQSTCSSAKDQQIAHFLSFKLSGVKHQTLRALLPFLAKRNQTDMLSNFLPWCLLPNQTPIVHTHIYIYIHIDLVQVESSGHFTSPHFTTLHSFTASLHITTFFKVCDARSAPLVVVPVVCFAASRRRSCSRKRSPLSERGPEDARVKGGTPARNIPKPPNWRNFVSISVIFATLSGAGKQ